MKILPKREIDRIKQQERKREIDEGIALAKKIDAMRENLQKLIKQTEDYIANRKQIINTELAELEEELKNKKLLINK